jgi:tyrosinase
MFWLWQQKHGATKSFDILSEFPGANSSNPVQGPTPGVPPNTWLTMDSALDPFRLSTSNGERPYTSRDCIDIEGQLGYSYGDGSMPTLPPSFADPTTSKQSVRVSGVNRAGIRGSFLISAFATIDGERRHIGTEAVLSRWNVVGCANCQTHLDVTTFFGLHHFKVGAVTEANVDVELRTRSVGPRAPGAMRAAVPAAATRRLRFEIR